MGQQATSQERRTSPPYRRRTGRATRTADRPGKRGNGDQREWTRRKGRAKLKEKRSS